MTRSFLVFGASTSTAVARYHWNAEELTFTFQRRVSRGPKLGLLYDARTAVYNSPSIMENQFRAPRHSPYTDHRKEDSQLGSIMP